MPSIAAKKLSILLSTLRRACRIDAASVAYATKMAGTTIRIVRDPFQTPSPTPTANLPVILNVPSSGTRIKRGRWKRAISRHGSRYDLRGMLRRRE